ncbi:MAG: GNAT family N-acetyltransferase [Phycisphaerae bacterium]
MSTATPRLGITTAEKALGLIHRGERIWISSGSTVPQALTQALINPELPIGDNEILHLLTLGEAPYCKPELRGKFRHNALFIGPNVRDAVREGRADYTPIFLSEIPGLIRAGRIPIDAALLSCTPPDAEGYVSVGTHVDIAHAAVEVARVVIAQVNEHVPRTGGATRIHTDQIHAMVRADQPLPELRPPKVRGETEAIARNIAELVPDGATLQLGIGGIPDGVLRFLRDRKDLGIHTEMFSDGVVELVEAGVINGRRKSLHPGKIVSSFIMGSRKTYEWLRDNPIVELHPCDYTNDPFIIAQNDNMIAINTCLQIDLTGQVCSDSIGSEFYSGIGGQVDFIRGAARSRGGKPIIALPSTARDGIVSRVVPRLDDGAGVVTTRGDVHWVVSEFGAVNLHGRSVRERALALISVAHPKFRPWLLAEAKRLNFIFGDQIEPPVHTPIYPKALETRMKASDGTSLLVRPIRATDETLLHDLFYRLGQDTIHQRFFSIKKFMPHEHLQRFCNVDYEHDMTLIAVLPHEARERVVAFAGYNLESSSGMAEASFVVEDAFQGRGIGTLLMRRLTEVAEVRGVRGFTASVLADNLRMLRVFEKCGYPLFTERDGDVLRLRIPFEETPRAGW